MQSIYKPQGNGHSDIVEKLKERQPISKQKYLLARKCSEEEGFWHGHADALEVAILIVECD